MRSILLLAILAWYNISPSAALPSNRTIDDTFGDPFTSLSVDYFPSTQGVWKNQDCSDCALSPDTSQAFDHTYTAATYNPGLGEISATLRFQGVAIYAFFILANNAPPGITTNTVVKFSLDGQPAVTVAPNPDPNTNFQYNVMLWSQTDLLPTEHTLVISTSGLDENVYVNFDYAMYTFDDEFLASPPPPPPPLPSSSPTRVPGESIPPKIISSAAVSSRTSSSLVQVVTTPSSTTPVSSTATSSTVMPPMNLSPVPAIVTILSTTTPSSSPSPSSASSKSQEADTKSGSHEGEIVGGAVSGVVILFTFPLIVVYLRRRYRRRHRLRFRSQPITSYPNDCTDVLRPLSPVVSSSDDRSSIRGTSPGLSYTTGTDVAPTGVTSPPDDVRRARQEQLDHQLTERQEVMREVLSDLDRTTDANDRDNRPRHVRNVSVHTLRRLRSFVGRDGPQREGGGGEPAATGDSNATVVEGATEVSVEELQELNRLLRLEIEYLKLQQQSPWAQGLSDDLPPKYTPLARRSQNA